MGSDIKYPLIISYFAHNKGTTDYVVDFLIKSKEPFYYLRHPLPESGIKSSELLYYSPTTGLNSVRTYKAPSMFISKLLKEQFVSGITVARLKFSNRLKLVVSFGSINSLLPILMRSRTIFWGVDYSEKRFNASVMNRLYLASESFACRYARATIQPTISQRDMRIKEHGLTIEKAVLIPNGIEYIQDLPRANVSKAERAFIYIGSLSKQHGVKDFIINAYDSLSTPPMLYVFGDGDEKLEIDHFLRHAKNASRISMKGSVSPTDIQEFVRSSSEYLIGIAPYKDIEGGHVKHGDSLKIKEYVNLGMPFIASDKVKIDSILSECGVVYHNNKELIEILEKRTKSLTLSRISKERALKQYNWNTLLKRKMLPIFENQGVLA